MDERELFEQWAIKNNYGISKHNCGEYIFVETENAQQVWDDARAQLLEQITLLKRRVAEIEKDYSILEQNYDAAIELARKPKKLVFVDVDDDWQGCETPFGLYAFYKFDSGYMVAFEHVKVAENLSTEQDAIAAAQADYDKRCGECFE